jgi:hypothetical protein
MHPLIDMSIDTTTHTCKSKRINGMQACTIIQDMYCTAISIIFVGSNAMNQW